MKNNLRTIAVFNKTTLRSLLQFARAYMSGRVSLKTFCSLVVTVFHRHSLRNLRSEIVVSLPALFETL